MIALLATVVDTGALLKTVAASIVAGVGVSAVFAVAILGAARFTDMTRDSRPIAASVFGLLTALTLAVCVASIVFGLVVMTQK